MRFRMKTTGGLGVPLHPVPVACHDDATDSWVGLAQPNGLLGQFKAPFGQRVHDGHPLCGCGTRALKFI
jgi:hypothetical protein